MKECSELKRPVLLGASRKSFIGMITHGGVDERMEGGHAAVAAGFFGGVNIFRVHDVLATKKFLDVLWAIGGT
jgi:dihydropteroate synthase